jgi:hypothetical protein
MEDGRAVAWGHRANDDPFDHLDHRAMAEALFVWCISNGGVLDRFPTIRPARRISTGCRS